MGWKTCALWPNCVYFLASTLKLTQYILEDILHTLHTVSTRLVFCSQLIHSKSRLVALEDRVMNLGSCHSHFGMGRILNELYMSYITLVSILYHLLLSTDSFHAVAAPFLRTTCTVSVHTILNGYIESNTTTNSHSSIANPSYSSFAPTHAPIWPHKKPPLQLRPYTPESTGSRLISEVKLVMAQSVLWWGTTREYCVL
jgi:hypothetical protein